MRPVLLGALVGIGAALLAAVLGVLDFGRASGHAVEPRSPGDEAHSNTNESLRAREADGRSAIAARKHPQSNAASANVESAPQHAEAPTELESWSAAKLAMRGDFDLSADDRSSFNEWVLTIRGEKAEVAGLAAPVNLLDPSSIEWENALDPTHLEGGLSEAQVEKMQSVANDYRALLLDAAEPAFELYRDSLHRYWELDQGYRFRTDQPYRIPDEFWKKQGGRVNRAFTAKSGDWGVAVNFESGGFPEFEGVLAEIVRLREEAASSIVTLAR